MTFKGPCVRKFTELMPNHILGNINWDKLISVVNGQRMTDEIRRDRRGVTNETDALAPQQVSPLVEENRKAGNYRR